MKMTYLNLIGATALSAFMTLPISATYAADAVENDSELEVEIDPSRFDGTFFKDPTGIRGKLSDAGVDLTLFYVNQFATNLQGGTRTVADYSDMFFFGIDFDLEKAPISIPGGSFHVTFTNRNGVNVAGEAELGVNLLVNEVFGQGSVTRLNHFFYEQDLFDNELTLKFGRINGSFDFFPFSCEFQRLQFCSAIPSYIHDNYTPFPGHTWGGNVTWRPTDDTYIKAGLVEINPDFDIQENGLDFFPIGDGLGERFHIEAGHTFRPGGLPGTYRVGYFRDNVGANSVTTGLPTGEQESWYFLFDQVIWEDQNSDRNIQLFGSYTAGDSETSATAYIAEIGAFINGPFASRPQDQVGIAVGVQQDNDNDLGLGQINDSLPGFEGSELNFEIYYKYSAGDGIFIQPNLQYIDDPAGFEDTEDALVFGVKSVVVF